MLNRFVLTGVKRGLQLRGMESECGRQSIRTGRIVGGDDAYEGEFPWTVSLVFRTSLLLLNITYSPALSLPALASIFLPVLWEGEMRTKSFPSTNL